jgi:hypothetical protein
VNHARTPSCQVGATRPESATDSMTMSCSKSRRKSDATPRDSTIAITFSWCDHESSVQFVEPVQTASPSRTTYLWCIRSGTPAIAFASIGSDLINVSSGEGGGGTGIGLRWSVL